MKKSKKKLRQEMVCSKCYKELQSDDLFCHECGEPTKVLKKDLSASRNWRETWADFKDRKGENYPFAIFFVFVILVPLFLIIIFLRESYLITNLALLLFLPLAFVPFAVPIMGERMPITIGKYLRNLKHYPKLFLFVLVNIVYFFLLKVITSSVDPILNLVRLIMVLYWIAVIVPYPHLLLRKKVNPLKGLLIVYRGGKETRWQQFFICVYLVVVNIIGLAILGIGLLVTVPYTIAVLERYYLQMERLGLLDPGKGQKA
jgi:hypothetical protein